jgi:hypothetical protein
MQASQGGARGTPAEAAQTKAWPSYEAAYLQNRLHGKEDKYDARLMTDDAARAVYLDKVTENYKDEADECLKAEFKDWLEGRHEDNVKQAPYENRAGAPARRYTYHTDIPLNSGGIERKAPGDLMENGKWKPTWWGKDSLTHLPGVRDFLRGEKKAGWENDFQMNMLAEHGPQDVEQAWQYFKHWVKGRPMTDAVCLPPQPDAGVNAGRVGPINHMHTRKSWAGGQEPPEPPGVDDLKNSALVAAGAAGGVTAPTIVGIASADKAIQAYDEVVTANQATQTRATTMEPAEEGTHTNNAAENSDKVGGPSVLDAAANAASSITRATLNIAGLGGDAAGSIAASATNALRNLRARPPAPVEGTPVQVARVAAQGSDDAHAESDNNVRVQQRILELEEEKRHREEERKHEKKMKRLQKELERTNPGVNAP